MVLFLFLFLLLTSGARAEARDLIVGGQNVDRRDPVSQSTVGIFSPGPDGKSGALCTGTLIRKDIALTAAHCVSAGAKPVLIFNRDLHAPGAEHRESQGVAVNPRWRKRAGHGMDQGDIALVKFNGRLPRGYRTVPAIGSDAEVKNGTKVTLAGYGISNARTHTGAGRLRKTEVRVLNGRPGKSEMILDQSHGHGACHGDSGGPAFVSRNGRVALAGLTNRSYPDTAPDDCAHQVVYTKVPAYKRWIEQSEKRLAVSPGTVMRAPAAKPRSLRHGRHASPKKPARHRARRHR